MWVPWSHKQKRKNSSGGKFDRTVALLEIWSEVRILHEKDDHTFSLLQGEKSLAKCNILDRPEHLTTDPFEKFQFWWGNHSLTVPETTFSASFYESSFQTAFFNVRSRHFNDVTSTPCAHVLKTRKNSFFPSRCQLRVFVRRHEAFVLRLNSSSGKLRANKVHQFSLVQFTSTRIRTLLLDGGISPRRSKRCSLQHTVTRMCK